MDAQSGKNSETAALTGYDAGTKISGQRRDLHTFKVIPQRWVVEHSFAWLVKSRQLWKNCERLLNTSLQFIHLAFLALCSSDFKQVPRAEEGATHSHFNTYKVPQP